MEKTNDKKRTRKITKLKLSNKEQWRLRRLLPYILERTRNLRIFAPSQSPITTMGCWDNQQSNPNGLIEK